MKNFKKILFIVIFFMPYSAFSSSVDYNAKLKSTFCLFIKKMKDEKQPVVLVFGCGKYHNLTTTGGLEHNHERAFTINLKEKDEQYGVCNPNFVGNVEDLNMFKSLLNESVDIIIFEHCGNVLNDINIGKHVLYQVRRVLKVGGKLLYYSGLSCNSGNLSWIENGLSELNFEISDETFKWIGSSTLNEKDANICRNTKWPKQPPFTNDEGYFFKIETIKKS